MPGSLGRTVLECLRDNEAAGHLWYEKTSSQVSDRYFWLGVAAAVKDCGLFYLICQERKAAARRGRNPLGEMPHASRSWDWEFILLDLKDTLPEIPSGNLYLLVVYDSSLEYMMVQLLTDKRTETVSKALMKYVVLHSAHQPASAAIRRRNLNHLLREVCQQFQKTKMRTSVAHPVRNEGVETVNGTTGSMLRV
ncbi:unnamed protein product [Natator depressus]